MYFVAALLAGLGTVSTAVTSGACVFGRVWAHLAQNFAVRHGNQFRRRSNPLDSAAQSQSQVVLHRLRSASYPTTAERSRTQLQLWSQIVDC